MPLYKHGRRAYGTCLYTATVLIDMPVNTAAVHIKLIVILASIGCIDLAAMIAGLHPSLRNDPAATMCRRTSLIRLASAPVVSGISVLVPATSPLHGPMYRGTSTAEPRAYTSSPPIIGHCSCRDTVRRYPITTSSRGPSVSGTLPRRVPTTAPE